MAYSYDFADRPLSVIAGTTPLVTSAKYHPFGPAIEILFGNGTTQTTDYDARYRIEEHRLTGPTGTIASYDYVSDAAGNITDIRDLVDHGYDRHFGYDDLNRLTVANTGAALWQTGSYSYDAMGNLTSYTLGNWRSGTLTYPSATPQVGGIVYDAAGNETAENIWTRKYSPRNQMIALDDDRDAAGVRRHIGYGYDGRGVRVWRGQGLRADVTTPDAIRRYVYSPELQLLLMTNDSRPLGFAKSFFSPLNIRSEFIWFGTTPLASLAPGSAPLLYFTDHLGTPLIQIDSTGKVAWRAEYEPYGNVAVMRVGTASDQPLRLPGQEYERTYQGAEENYNIFRWYRTASGRYTQAEPDGLAAGLNLYGYVSGRPIVAADALGLIGTLYNPSYPPQYPVPSGCTATGWQFEGKSEQTTTFKRWKLKFGKPVEIAGTKSDVAIGCQCIYEYHGFFEKMTVTEKFKRTVTCCESSWVETATTSWQSSTVPAEGIYPPGALKKTMTVLAKLSESGGCLCKDVLDY